MSAHDLTLRIALDRTEVSQLESVSVTVTLTNVGPEVVVPSAYDSSGALSLLVLDGERIVRTSTSVTRQKMMSGGRLDTTPTLESLSPGAGWSVAHDLGKSMYAPPPGRYEVSAELALPDGERVVSNREAVEVRADPVSSVLAVRDNPVIDGLALLIERADAEHPFLLRQYGATRPLGAWYSADLPFQSRPTLARPTYFDTSSFDPFFERWLIARHGGALVARQLTSGAPTGAVFEAAFPPEARLLATACDHGAGRLDVFALLGPELVCFTAARDAWRERWRLALPPNVEGEPWIVSDGTSFRVTAACAGLSATEVDAHGVAAPWRRLFNTDLRCAELSVDTVHRRVLAAFWDGAVGEHLQLVEAALDTPDVFVAYSERQGALKAVRELAFDRDRRGLFHLLVNCEAGLVYQSQEVGPFALLPPHARRAPRVSARPGVHLGFYDEASGYQYYRFSKNRLLFRGSEANMANEPG
jgi:hypothetical protein